MTITVVSFIFIYFCSLAVRDPRVGHTMNVFFHLFLSSVILIDSSTESPIYVLMMSILAFVYQTLFLVLSLSPLFRHGMLASMSNNSLFTPVLLRTHSFVFFTVHEPRRILLSPFISKASRCVSSFFVRIQLLFIYVIINQYSMHAANFITNDN